MKKFFLFTVVMCLFGLFGHSQNVVEQNVPSYQNYVMSRSSGEFSVAGFSQMGTGNIMYLTGNGGTLTFDINTLPNDTTSWEATVMCGREMYCSFYRTDGTGEVYNFSYLDPEWERKMRGHGGNYTLYVYGDLNTEPSMNPLKVMVSFVFTYAPTASWINMDVRRYEW